MLLTTKKLAFLGVLLAATVTLIILSGVFEFNTLFLLGAASFGVGIALRECGIRIGFGFYIAAILLSFILAPNKLYCITFGVMGLFLVIEDIAFVKLTYVKWKKNRSKIFWLVKYIAFNLMFLPILIFMPKLIYPGEINKGFLIVIFIIGQIVLFVYDMAHDYFQKHIWGKLRGKMHL